MNVLNNLCHRLPLLTSVIVVLGCLVLRSGHAQSLPPALMVEENERSKPLLISKVEVEVQIHGFIAETRMTMVFQNPHDRPLAGDLYFPLPVGATVSGYALDVNGVMVDGVVVDKDKGRQVFEKETRKGVDPGLVEWTRGNHFKTRVFPIPPRGSRTVRVSYVGEVVTDANGSHYELPLNFKAKLPEFHLRVEVIKAAAQPVLQRGSAFNLQFTKWREGFVAESRRTNASVAGNLVVELPKLEQQRVVVERASDGEYYFCINDFPIDPRPAETKPTLPALKQVTIYWDASGSRGATDHARELAWLKTWFTAYAKHSIAVNLVPFRNTMAPVQRFAITNGEADALLNAISKISYDGGTQIGCLTNIPVAKGEGWNFLFCDGLSNFGEAEPAVLGRPLFIFTADQTVDQPFLQHLAQRFGGAVSPLRRLTDQQVFLALATKPFTFLGGAAASTGIAELCPQTTQPLQKRFTVAGKLTATEAAILLNYGSGRKVLSQSQHAITKQAAVPGDLLRRFWAQRKLEGLLVLQRQNETEITELGKRHGLVTPYTSLMVLEQLEQYVEHRIMPPASLSEMRQQYARIVEDQAAEAKQTAHDKTEQLLAAWTKRVEWWNTKFKPVAKFQESERGDQASRRRPGAVTPLRSGATLLRPAEPSALPASAVAPMVTTLDASSGAVLDGTDYLQDANVLGGGPADAANSQPEPGIAIKEWDPKTPYLEALKRAGKQDAFSVYLAQRKKFGRSPAFYLDCAEFFRKQKQDEVSLQILSNIAELDLENAALLRVLAYRLLQIGQLDLACGLFEEILRMRPEEPQSFRDLALALAKRGQTKSDPADCRRALELLAKVVNQKWDRFEEIEVIALMEMNALWADCGRRFPQDNLPFPVDRRLQKLLDLDVRILLTWDADMTDVDLHVVEPSGEEAYYSHNLTTLGGLVSCDFTQGYGPEEYCLRKAQPGTYKIAANYYGSQAAQIMGPVTVQAEIITNFGRPTEKRKSLTLRLEDKKDMVVIGEVEF
jgi:Ca-activated chloride channel family protein